MNKRKKPKPPQVSKKWLRSGGFVSESDAAARLGVEVKTLRNLVAAGTVERVLLRVYSLESVESYLERRQQAPAGRRSTGADVNFVE